MGHQHPSSRSSDFYHNATRQKTLAVANILHIVMPYTQERTENVSWSRSSKQTT
jgi:hypothetical protein